MYKKREKKRSKEIDFEELHKNTNLEVVICGDIFLAVTNQRIRRRAKV